MHNRVIPFACNVGIYYFRLASSRSSATKWTLIERHSEVSDLCAFLCSIISFTFYNTNSHVYYEFYLFSWSLKTLRAGGGGGSRAFLKLKVPIEVIRSIFTLTFCLAPHFKSVLVLFRPLKISGTLFCCWKWRHKFQPCREDTMIRKRGLYQTRSLTNFPANFDYIAGQSDTKNSKTNADMGQSWLGRFESANGHGNDELQSETTKQK